MDSRERRWVVGNSSPCKSRDEQGLLKSQIITHIGNKGASTSFKRFFLTKEGRIQLVIIGFVIAALAAAFGYILIEVIGFRPQCSIHLLTGFSCITCGSTRLVEALLEFNILQAFRWNPFIFISLLFLPFVLYKALRDFIVLGYCKAWVDKLLIQWLIVGTIFMVLRNLPMFSFLLPTQL